jgi:glycosyltransferase involved in cell wall biosynthesis
VVQVKFRENDRLNFDFLAPMASADGYGYSAEELVRAAVQTHGAQIGYVIHDWADPKYTGTDVKSLEVSRESIGQKEVFVQYFIPYAFYQNRNFPVEIPIGQTMFETTEIPDIWAYCMQFVKGVIVPSEFCKRVFEKKVTVPVHVAPLGVNPLVYPYVERAPSDVFTFLMAGSLHYRKGVEFAVKAFKTEFSRNEKVRLILKTRKDFLDTGREFLDDPRIQVVNCDYDRQDMLDLYHAADCFIACSRGEASGLTPREAMATGIPAIVTNWGGLEEIADERYSYPLDIVGEVEAPPVCTSYDDGITQGQSIGNFCEPSVDHLRTLMREAYDNPQENLAKGRRASEWIARDWNYDICSRKWLDAIERIYDEAHR